MGKVFIAIFLKGTHIGNLSPSSVYRGEVVRREPRSRTDAHQSDKQARLQPYHSLADRCLYYIRLHIYGINHGIYKIFIKLHLLFYLKVKNIFLWIIIAVVTIHIISSLLVLTLMANTYSCMKCNPAKRNSVLLSIYINCNGAIYEGLVHITTFSWD